MRKKLRFIMVTLSLALVACGGNSNQSLDEPDRGLRDSLTNKNWVLESYGFQMDNKTDVIENSLRFEVQFSEPENFEAGEYRGYEYCNGMWGSYETDGNSIVISGPATSRMDCGTPQAIGELEKAAYREEVTTVIKAFRESIEFEVRDDILTLSTAESMQLIFVLGERN